ncbi:MAG TPA: hypothetical protein VK652_01450, partial [Steroidobacteraceae bacterium]|nr:hypothetical protein [Steroidobacteraceae bacterium]
MTLYDLVYAVLHVVAVVECGVYGGETSFENDLVRSQSELVGCCNHQLATAVHDDDVGSKFTHDCDLLLCDSHRLVTQKEIVLVPARSNYRKARSPRASSLRDRS